MRRLTMSVLGAAAAVVLAIGAGSGPATAVDDGRSFGQHVRTCAQTVGFDGDHNPGMHARFTDGHPHHDC